MSAELRTLGALYGDPYADSDKWESQWVNGSVQHRDGNDVPTKATIPAHVKAKWKHMSWAERIMAALMWRLEEVELRQETGRAKQAVWTSKIRLTFFNVIEPKEG